MPKLIRRPVLATGQRVVFEFDNARVTSAVRAAG